MSTQQAPNLAARAHAPKGSKRGCLYAALIVGALGIFGVIALGAAGYYWFKANEDDLKTMGTEAAIQGDAYGQGKTADDCLHEGLRQLDECGGNFDIMCQAQASLFTQYCFAPAEVPPDFCEGVPKSEEIMDSVSWRAGRCGAIARTGDQSCGRFMEVIQKYCHGE
ncbi:MAG: hypothetical protein OXT09_16085 [Myxococcales bacterium]|nr:hypothetical protein [Myxococcales bacterium]